MFHQRLDQMLATAVERGILPASTADALRSLAREGGRERGALTLTSALGWLGGAAVVLGIILLIGSNWEAIPDGAKLAGFFVLLGGAHAAGFWLGKSKVGYERTAEAFHFIGGGLFLAGVGLVAQIYHLNSRPPNGVLLWWLAVAPLAVLLRSLSLGMMAICAFFLWAHMEGSFDGSPLKVQSTLASYLTLDVGLGAALIGFSGALKRAEPRLAQAFRFCGTVALFGALYLLGFYRYFGATGRSPEGSTLLPWAALALGAVGLVIGARHLSPESAWLRNRLIALLASTLALAGMMLSADAGLIPQGPTFESFEFGWTRHHVLAEWALTILAWAAWFLLSLWCVAWGARSDHKGFVNLGVLAVGTGIVTRFFDLAGSMAQTGTLFVVGGLVLLGTAFGMERWRRGVLNRMTPGKAAA